MKPYRVLIVEDHPFQHEYLRNLFSDLSSFNVDSVWDGATALRRLRTTSYDLIVSDLFMPGMDGVQLIQNIAKLNDRPALALMSVASRRMLISAGLVAKNLGLEVLGLISKPVNPAAVLRLRDNIDSLCKRRVATATSPLKHDRQRLLHAMHTGQMQAWFQPKKSLRDGRVCSAEALVRWQHPQLGTIMPGDFLPAMQRFGLEENLLWLMLEQTLNVQSLWRRRGYDVPVSVNLPTHLLGKHDLADRLHASVKATGAEPSSICFELLESSTPDALSDYYAGACRLRMMGFGLAQDDFGTGFSSYFNLVSTPFSELKIDRSLVHGCVESEGLAAALQSIVELCRKLGLTVTAEGVETPAELAFFRKIQCDQVQGFLICAAVPPEQFFDLLREDGLTPAPK
ncbi:diguanylate phosphodiesterase [Pseudomonas fluorescens HK44]|uniref:Diguanylate phosphodiesterase n=1 Tax=Pseudomonas fluorescens HK44 TaxID=1042209 RepID=A0A010RTG3_PSEFL|nr:EAL domain-containing response regulator [Pseudomonas fluorescens]EXF95611.1 diguanylate phosphodiesterase [Pseudomonas fluorescens HK44]